MANNQSQSQNSSRSQSGGGSRSQTQGSSQTSSSTSPSTSGSTTASSGGSTNQASGNGSDMIEQTISKGVSQLLQTLEPQLNRIGNQLVDRVMSRGQNIADTGVKRMQEQPWYMVGGALALVAVGIGLLFAFEGESTGSRDFSSTNIQ